MVARLLAGLAALLVVGVVFLYWSGIGIADADTRTAYLTAVAGLATLAGTAVGALGSLLAIAGVQIIAPKAPEPPAEPPA